MTVRRHFPFQCCELMLVAEDSDVVYASSSLGKVAWFKNNGDGTFVGTEFQITVTTPGAWCVRAWLVMSVIGLLLDVLSK